MASNYTDGITNVVINWDDIDGGCNCLMEKAASRVKWEEYNVSSRFIEEVVTSPDLAHDHDPVDTVNTLQLPYLIKAEKYNWPLAKDRSVI